MLVDVTQLLDNGKPKRCVMPKRPNINQDILTHMEQIITRDSKAAIGEIVLLL